MHKPSLSLIVVASTLLFMAGCSATSDPAGRLGTPVASPAAFTSLSQSGSAPTRDADAEGLYYLEFRSRSALSYGHSFAMFGRRGAQNQILTREVAGLHPASTSNIPYTLGHLIPVPSETGASDGDLDDAYMTARYRINLTEPEYRKVLAYIRDLQDSSPVWHAVLYNCNAFVGDIAQFMGLKTPASLLFPENYITRLREINT